MELAALIVAIGAAIAAVVEGYLLWRQHQRADQAEATQIRQADELEGQRHELARTREVAEEAQQATLSATLRVVAFERLPETAESQVLPGVATTKVSCGIRNLGPAVVRNLRLERIYVSGAIYSTPIMSQNTVSTLGPGEEHSFVVDTQVTLGPFSGLFGLAAGVSYQDGLGAQRVKLTYP